MLWVIVVWSGMAAMGSQREHQMLGAVNQDNLVFEEPVPPEENKEKRMKGNC